MRVVGIIPARLNASRFPSKPMAEIHGIPMIGHCYHRTRLALGIENTYVATCDDIIAKYVDGIGGMSVMTSENHTRATTRTAEALAKIEASIGGEIDIVVMVQGDEPLILPETIAATLEHFKDEDVSIVNIMSRLTDYDQFLDKNNVKVVVSAKNDALYFSREPIPSPWRGTEGVPMFMQTGIIAFRRNTLLEFNKTDETLLEKIESIDMNRVLECGGQISMVLTDAKTIGVDTFEELGLAADLMKFDPVLGLYK